MSELNQLYYEEIDRFIRDYIQNDHSGRAIMLSGDWGSGKSHYLRHELQEYLFQELECKCVIVSLYGLTDVSEISKAIYVELRSLKKRIKSEASNSAAIAGKIIGKTIFNGLVNKIGFDIGKIDDKDLQKVYESVDLTNKLIIFEDLERTQIDVTELLGYINNMCEVDKTKVLLIANEYAVGKEYYYSKKDDIIKFKLTRKYAEYQKIKEKTVGDTIKFECNLEHCIREILPTYDIPVSEIAVKEIIEILHNTGKNLRSFQFACQKYVEIKKLTNNVHKLNDKLEKIIFHGIIAYIQYKDKGRDVKFECNSFIYEMIKGTANYRLFKFCYDYIKYQRFDNDAAKNQLSYYNEYCRYSKWNKDHDTDLQIIKYYRVQKADDVKRAINNIHEKIDSGDITYWDYPELLGWLINIHSDVKIDSKYKEISNLMIKRLESADNKDKISEEELFGFLFAPIGEREEYIKIIRKMKSALKSSYSSTKPIAIEELNFTERSNITAQIAEKGFSSVFNIDDFCSVLEVSSSKQLCNIYSILDESYNESLNTDRIDEDDEELKTIKKKVDELKEKDWYDEIQKRNYERISEIITDILNHDIEIEAPPVDGRYI